MDNKIYSVYTVDAANSHITLNVPVIPQALSSEQTKWSKFSSRGRAYQANRAAMTAKVQELLSVGFAGPHTGSLTPNQAKCFIESYDLATLEVLYDEFNRGSGPTELINFLSAHKTGAPAFLDEDFQGQSYIRELAVYGRPYSHISGQMLRIIIDNLRVSHPLFAREDLSELQGESAEMFTFALKFSVLLYEYHEDKKWDEEQRSGVFYRESGVFREAQERAPRFSTEFLVFLLENIDQADKIVRYLWLTNADLLEIDVQRLKHWLDTSGSSRAKSLAVDASLVVSSFVKYSYQKLRG